MFICAGTNLMVDKDVINLIRDLMSKVTGHRAAIDRVRLDIGALGKGIRNRFLNDGFLKVTVLSEDVIAEVS